MELHCSSALGGRASCTGEVGDFEAGSLDPVESPFGYHPRHTSVLTGSLDGTLDSA